MVANCAECDRIFDTKEALQQHLRDSPVHAVTHDCDECDRSFNSESALQQHLRDSPAHAVTYDCDECDRSFNSESALQQHLRYSQAHAIGAKSYDLWPSLHHAVCQHLRAHNLSFDFNHSDDPQGATKEYDTSVMGTFDCTNGSCESDRWSSRQIAVTIRQYPGKQYNAKVYSQRCESCDSLSQPALDDSYAKRVAYRLAKWSGVAVEPPPFSGKSKGPYQSDLCEGCKYGHCSQSRL